MTTLNVTAQIKRSDTLESVGTLRSHTLTGDVEVGAILHVTTSEATIDLTDLGNVGFCFVENMEAAGGNDIRLGFATGVYYVELEAQEQAVFPLLSTLTALYVVAPDAGAGNCSLRYRVVER